ncbi:hypothetical protein ACWEOW_11165 [Monashia sp. NPDC004114]
MSADTKRTVLQVSSTDLDDDTRVVECINTEGDLVWIIETPHECTGCCLSEPPVHERLGTLPPEFRPRCSGTKKDGLRCGNFVPQWGDRCYAHPEVTS